MESTQDARLPHGQLPSADLLLDIPLVELLVEAGVGLDDAAVAAPAFFGAVCVRRNGDLVLAMPSGRSRVEHDTIARHLVGQALGAGLRNRRGRS